MEPDPSATPEPGVPSDNTTLTEVLDAFRDRGFGGDMFVTPEGMVRCGRCHEDMPPSGLSLDRLQRIEGASDPADMAAVLALTCTHCGTQGTVVVRFGPEAGPEDDAVLQAVEDRRFESS